MALDSAPPAVVAAELAAFDAELADGESQPE